MIEDFFHLPPVLTTPVVHLELGISPRIFEKIWNSPNGILRGLGETYSWKNQKSNSRDTVPLRKTGVALSSQSELPTFISARQVNLKISHRILLNPTIPENGLIPEDDLLRMAISRKMTYRDWPNLSLKQAGIGKIPKDDISWLAKSQIKTSRNR